MLPNNVFSENKYFVWCLWLFVVILHKFLQVCRYFILKMDFEVCDKFCWSQLTTNIAHCTVHGSTLGGVEQRDMNW